MNPPDLSILPKSDPKSPFHSRIPDNTRQTETLSKRFDLWRSIIKSLITYYKTIIISNQQFSVVNTNVANSFNFPFFTNVNTSHLGSNGTSRTLDLMDPDIDNLKKQSFFSKFGEGSIQDVQILLKKYHLNLAIHQKQISLDLANVIVPKLEELQKDLVIKIKEIKNLSNDFKDNSLKEEIALTGQLLDDYIESMKDLTDKGDCDKDPYLYRIRLEIQLKQQLHVENYLEEAFMNLQMTSLMLEKIIFKEIQSSLNKYSELISQEIFIHYNDLINELHQGIISKKSHFEWDNFIAKDNGKIFLNIKHDDNLPNAKKISDLKYPFNKSIISKTIRSGELHKKSKILKTYSKSFFILTLNYLHEFKNSKLDGINITPIHSIKLNDCLLVDSNESKFQLKVKTADSKSFSYVFKNVDLPPGEFQKWIKDLKALTSFNSFTDRYDYVSKKYSSHQMYGLASASSSTNKLQPSSSNLSIRSNTQTPSLELQNPMDLTKIYSKLENLQMTRNTPKKVMNPDDYIPPVTRPENHHYHSNHKVHQTNGKNAAPKLAVETRPSLLTTPTVEIQAPTPTRPQAQLLPSDTSLESTVSSISPSATPSLHKKTQSDESYTDISRSATPMIGTNVNITVSKSESPNEEELGKKIQLSDSLYDENTGNPADLSKLLKQMNE